MTVILIADDHPLFREALRDVILRTLPDAHVHEADQISSLYELIRVHPDADLLMLDLGMPGSEGFGPLTHMRRRYPRLPILIVTASVDPLLMRDALNHGAAGFIPKSVGADILSPALLHVLKGGIWLPEALGGTGTPGEQICPCPACPHELTAQQFRVLKMAGAGLLNKQIAYELQVAEATVKAHMTAIMRKLHVSNRTQAVLIAQRLGLKPWR